MSDKHAQNSNSGSFRGLSAAGTEFSRDKPVCVACEQPLTECKGHTAKELVEPFEVRCPHTQPCRFTSCKSGEGE